MAKLDYKKIQKGNRPLFLKPYLLLHPPIPKPLHGVNPRSVKGKKWWDEKRFAAQAKNNFHCWSCGVHKSEAMFHKWLEGHESYFVNWETGEMELEEIVSLCHACHNYIHSGLLKVKLRKGEVDEQKYNFIIEHGNNIVRPLPDWKFPEKICSDWSSWHLKIEGEKFYSKFKNESEWEEYYSRR
jgi:hypothetical protein